MRFVFSVVVLLSAIRRGGGDTSIQKTLNVFGNSSLRGSILNKSLNNVGLQNDDDCCNTVDDATSTPTGNPLPSPTVDPPTPTTPTTPNPTDFPTPVLVSCPASSSEDPTPVPSDGTTNFKISSDDDTLCTLTYKTFSGGEEVLIPIGRHYNGNPWEAVAGPVQLSFDCTGEDWCSTHIPANLDSVEEAEFQLTSFNIPNDRSSLKSQDIAARFLERSTFGATTTDLENWKDISFSTTSDLDDSFANWVEEQIEDIELTSHRKYFRENASTHARSIKYDDTPYGTPLHPCDPGTRWRKYAFTSTDWSTGATVEVNATSDGSAYTFLINDVPLTEVTDVTVPAKGSKPAFDLQDDETYDLCDEMAEYIGGLIQLTDSDGTCREISVGNPEIAFNSDDPRKPDLIIQMDSSALASDFTDLPGGTTGEDFFLENGITDDVCDQLYVGAFPVYIEFSDGSYLAFDPRLDSMDNDIDNPALDGGNEKYLLGDRCANAPRTFLNEDKCLFSDEVSACSNEAVISDTEITLSEDNLKAIYDGSGRFVYAVNGLRIEDIGSPCQNNGRSRWLKIHDTDAAGTCLATSFDDDTSATLSSLLETQISDYSDAETIDILYQTSNGDCSVPVGQDLSGTSIVVPASGKCWSLVHPDHLSVYDFTPWVRQHPGGKAQIRQFAINDEALLQFPNDHVMERWEENKGTSTYIGILNYATSFRDLPSEIQTTSVMEYFDIQSAVSNDKVVVCGSPFEVANDHSLGETGLSFTRNSDINAYKANPYTQQKWTVWLKIVLSASDQLRQRMAWALAQIFAVNNADTSEKENSEGHLVFYDIFVRNAFGNYRDIMKEVSYSPMMGIMLSYRGSKSTAYILSKDNVIQYADENFAREIMQLFSMGTVMLNSDGTAQLDNDEQVLTYTNDHIQSYARAWTGFDYQSRRGNIERSNNNPNRIDPMYLEAEYRDVFPKIDLNNGYIGDGYPLCVDLPADLLTRQFLRKGSVYRLLGSSTLLQLQANPNSRFLHVDVTSKSIALDSSSELYDKLCNANGGSTCNYDSKVVLDENLSCNGDECGVDTLTFVEVGDGVYFEYVRQPCVELSFYNNGKTVTTQNRDDELCENPNLPVAGEFCSEDSGDWRAEAKNCKYIHERMAYDTAFGRCVEIGQTFSDYTKAKDMSGEFQGCWGYSRFHHWHPASCSVKIKVEKYSGYAAIVHDPASLQSEDDLNQKVRSDNPNLFYVHWDNDFPGSENNCGDGACETIGDECLCDTRVQENLVFSSDPIDAEDIRSSLSIGNFDPSTYDSGYFDAPVAINDYQVYFLSGQSYNKDTVFEIEYLGKTYFYKNIESVVHILNQSGQDTAFSLRNPPHFMNFVSQDARDAHHETDAVLDSYFYHPNVAPFVAIHFINRFGMSNPSPRFVEAVSESFINGVFEYTMSNGSTKTFGSGERGDLGAVAAAVLLDREALSTVLDFDSSYGSLREPALKVVNYFRAMEYETHGGYESNRYSEQLQDMYDTIGQYAHQIPTVFSFFLREYSPSGQILASDLVSPEAQRYSTPTSTGLINGLFSLTKFGFSNCRNGFGISRGSCGGLQENEISSANSWGQLSFSPESPNDSSSVVDELATLLTAGRLSDESREIIKNEFDKVAAGDDSDGYGLRLAQQLIAITPEFHSTSLMKFSGEARELPPDVEPSSEPFKAVINLLIAGALDSFNMIVPHSDCTDKDMYDEYETVRTSVAIDKSDLLQIDVSGQVCGKFGVHPDLPILQTLYNDGDLVFMANVGVLPTDGLDRFNWESLVTNQLFAHNTQQKDTQEIDMNGDQPQTGFLGRMADVLREKGFKTGSYSVGGGSYVLLGNPDESSGVVTLGGNGVTEFNQLESIDDMNSVMFNLNNVTVGSSGKFGKAWADIFDTGIRETELLYQVFEDMEEIATSFNSDSSLGKNLKQIASAIKSKDELGNDRQFFFTDVGGYDSHTAQFEMHDELLPALNEDLTAFVDEMKAQGVWDQVVLVMSSDFGRTLTANSGEGTDHAWGGNYFMMGGAIDGGQILGTYPDDLTATSLLNIGRGRLIPTTSWDAVLNPVAQWMGVTDSEDLDYFLPNRNEFTLYQEDDLFT